MDLEQERINKKGPTVSGHILKKSTKKKKKSRKLFFFWKQIKN